MDLQHRYKTLARLDAHLSRARACIGIAGRAAALQRLYGMQDTVALELVATLQETYSILEKSRFLFFLETRRRAIEQARIQRMDFDCTSAQK